MDTAKGIFGLFFALLFCHTCSGQNKHTIATYQQNPKYLKGNSGGPISCSEGKRGALEFHVLSPGLASNSNGVSLKTDDGDYVFEFGNSVYLIPFTESTVFYKAGTFIRHRNRFYQGTTAFESISNGKYFRCNGNELVLSQVNSEYDADRSSFIVKEVVPPDDGWTECTKTCGGGYQVPKKKTCFGFICSDVAPRPCNIHPCSDPDVCSQNPCKNGGKCSVDGFTIHCKCRPGYSGPLCENEPNSCRPNPCHNSGKCVRTSGGYQCYCVTGFTGKNCGVRLDYCDPDPCVHGSCSSVGVDFVCSCDAGYTGKRCDIVKDPCSPNPCQNNGNCAGLGTGYVCVCRGGWTGKNCDIPPNQCNPNPCQNSGDCVRLGSSDYTCQCKDGFSGKHCETSSSGGCSTNICRNGGTCVETANGYHLCQCAIGYYGPRCGAKLKIGETSPCTQTCGGGTRYTIQGCSNADILKCPRKYSECNTGACSTVNCASGAQFRYGTKAQCCRKPRGSTCGNPITSESGKRVIGGEVSEPMEWPWVVALFKKGISPLYFCGGGLVNTQWVLTAGHCVESFTASQISVLLGSNIVSKPDRGYKRIDVRKKVMHSAYDNPVNDLALLKLKRAVTISDEIKPICMPGGETLGEDVTCYAAGWGVAFEKDLPTRKNSDVLRHVGLPTVPLDACVQGYAGDPYLRGVTKNTICCGKLSGGKDTCFGDSGVPLVCQRKDSCEWFIAGITSFGPTECAVGGIPGGFVKVRNYESWIEKTINQG